MEPQQKTHWPSKEFDDLIEHAEKTKDEDEYLQRLKKAYLYAMDNAPPGTITAGKAHFRLTPDRVVVESANLNIIRYILEEEDLLAPEDSPE